MRKLWAGSLGKGVGRAGLEGAMDEAKKGPVGSRQQIPSLTSVCTYYLSTLRWKLHESGSGGSFYCIFPNSNRRSMYYFVYSLKVTRPMPRCGQLPKEKHLSRSENLK